MSTVGTRATMLISYVAGMAGGLGHGSRPEHTRMGWIMGDLLVLALWPFFHALAGPVEKPMPVEPT